MLFKNEFVMTSQMKIIVAVCPRSRNFLTFATENSLVVTLVSYLAEFDHHFFLDFIFH